MTWLCSAHAAPSSLPSSCGILGGLPSEQAADWRQGTAAVQGRTCSVQRHFERRVSWDALSYAPTILWLLDWSHMDANLDALALLGLGISSFILKMLRLRQYGPHGCPLGHSTCPGQRGTDLVRGWMGHLGKSRHGDLGPGRYAG